MKRKLWMLLAAAAAAAVLAIGGTYAYLTDYEKVDNQFTVGKVEIDLKEPGWKEEDHQRLVPAQNIKKDPQITNTGKNDAFVYLEVSVPVRRIETAKEDGSRNPQAQTQLFSFQPAGKWQEISRKSEGGYQVYTYCYKEILSPGKTTDPLFTEMKFTNVIEGQLEEENLQVPVRAYAIQSAHTGGDGASIPEQAKEAYQKYVNQNAEQPGKVTE